MYTGGDPGRRHRKTKEKNKCKEGNALPFLEKTTGLKQDRRGGLGHWLVFLKIFEWEGVFNAAIHP